MQRGARRPRSTRGRSRAARRRASAATGGGTAAPRRPRASGGAEHRERTPELGRGAGALDRSAIGHATVAAGRAHSQRSGRDSNPRDESTPPTRFPIALLQPLGHHSTRRGVSHEAIRYPGCTSGWRWWRNGVDALRPRTLRACRSSSCSSSDIGAGSRGHRTSLRLVPRGRHAPAGRAWPAAPARSSARTRRGGSRRPRAGLPRAPAACRCAPRRPRPCDRTPPRRSPRRPWRSRRRCRAFVARGARTAKRVSGPITAARRPPHTLRRCATRLPISWSPRPITTTSAWWIAFDIAIRASCSTCVWRIRCSRP